MPATIAVAPDPAGGPNAQRLAALAARELDLPSAGVTAPGDAEMLLVATGERLELRVVAGDASLRGGKPIAVDLLELDTRSNAGRRVRQPIARAVGLPARREKKLPPPHVVDATAGFGEDAWLLASLGCRVTVIERSPIVAALLRDGLERAGRAQPDVAARMTLRVGDSSALLREIENVDVVYLDPMFPPGRKTIERKRMRVLRELVGADEDAAALFDAALSTGARRVVVKRPSRAAPVSNSPPTVTHQGRALRYDVYIQT